MMVRFYGGRMAPSHQDIDELWAVESERRAAQIEGGGARPCLETRYSSGFSRG